MERQRGDVRFQVRRSDQVEDEVGASSRGAAHRLRESRRDLVARKHVRCTELEAGGVLGLGGGGQHELRDAAAELQPRRADAARCRMHDDDLSWSKPAEHQQIQPCGEKCLGNGGRLGEAHPLWDAHGVRGGYARELGVAAATKKRHHALAGHERRAALQDLAGDFQAEDLGFTGRRRIAAHPLQQVGPVDSGGADAHEQVAGSRLRIGHVAELQHLGTAGRLDDDGAHGGAR